MLDMPINHFHSIQQIHIMSKKKQTLEEKRIIREKYRTLAAETDERKAELINGPFEDLHNLILRTDALYSEVKKPQEAVLDSALLSKAVDIAAQRAKRVKMGDLEFDPDEYVSKVITCLGMRNGGTPDWDSLRLKAKSLCLLTPVIGFMYGPISVELKEKAPKKAAPKLVKSAIITGTEEVLDCFDCR